MSESTRWHSVADPPEGVGEQVGRLHAADRTRSRAATLTARAGAVRDRRAAAAGGPGRPAFTTVTADGPGDWDLPQPAPYAAAVADDDGPADAHAHQRRTPGSRFVSRDGVLDLRVEAGGRTTHHRSRRFGRLDAQPEALALTLTGTHLTGLTRERGRWRARARYDLSERLDTRDEGFCAGLRLEADGDVARRAGRRASASSGCATSAWSPRPTARPVRDGDRLLLTATHAGPGFFDAAHTGVWSLDPDGWVLEHRADLFFRRPDRPGVYGDNATHLVRDGDRWLVATSTWGDFDRAHKQARRVAVTLAESDADLLTGRHVLDTRPLRLPTDGLRSVGVWDPHLVRIDGRWHVGFVSAPEVLQVPPGAGGRRRPRRPRPARPPTPPAPPPRAPRCCGSTASWRVLASDGRQGPRGQRARVPGLRPGAARRPAGSTRRTRPTSRGRRLVRARRPAG